jgi:hypothetical protein
VLILKKKVIVLITGIDGFPLQIILFGAPDLTSLPYVINR